MVVLGCIMENGGIRLHNGGIGLHYCSIGLNNGGMLG